MSILVKPGVLFVYAPAGFTILNILKLASANLGINLTITSGADGVHSGPNDPHKKGEAYDIRSKDMSPIMKGRFLDFMRIYLGSRFYVFLEGKDTSNEHFHAQRSRNTVYTIRDFLDS